MSASNEVDVTFLLADIEGSTALVADAGAGYQELIAGVRGLVRGAVGEQGGAVVDTVGDEALAVFDEADRAVRAALTLQRSLRDAPWERDIRMRVGLHRGTPTLTDEGYVGIDVVRAARVGSIGHGGQIVATANTVWGLQDVPTRDLGEHRIEGLPEPIHIAQVLADDLPRDFPPLRGTISTLGDSLRVVLADDSVLLREGVARLLADSGFDVVAQSGDAEDLLRHVAMHKPDVAIVDIRMPPTHTDEGLVAAREIRERFPDTGVLVLSQYVESGYALDLLAESTEGVGYLLKDRVSDIGQFAASVRRVSDGGSVLDPAVVSELVGRRRQDDPLDELTAREREVLELMAEGRSNQAIADRMFVTLRAVEKHVTSIFSKLDLPASTDDHRRVLAVLLFLRS